MFNVDEVTGCNVRLYMCGTVRSRHCVVLTVSGCLF